MERSLQHAFVRLLTDDRFRRAVLGGAAVPSLRDEDRRRLAALDRERVEIFADILVQNRVDKAERALPWTVRLLGERRSELSIEFNRASPPRSGKPHREALALGRWLLARFAEEPATPPYLPDVIRFELASLELSFGFDGRYRRRRGSVTWPEHPGEGAWRALVPYRLRHQRVLEFDYDIVSIGAALSRGEAIAHPPSPRPRGDVRMLLHVQPSGELARLALGGATAAFLAACDGRASVGAILGGIARCAGEHGPDREALERGCFETCRELERRCVLAFRSGNPVVDEAA